uniref:Capsid protein n=1 Tax=Dromedary picobirnavirus TaxID=1574421 RepID=A0A0A1EJA7_9VIRU|nr:capsid protein [Dromedary picobirnavirus]
MPNTNKKDKMNKSKGNNKFNRNNSRDMSKNMDKKSKSMAENPMDRRGTYDVSKSTNDVSWYARNPQLLKDVASFPFSPVLGLDVKREDPYGTETPFLLSGIDDTPFAGVMAIHFRTVPGITKGTQADPINVAANNIYSYIRHFNSGSSNYDVPDLMLYLLAVNEIYSIYFFMRRIYNLHRTYAYKNRYYPTTLIQANGVNYNTLISDSAQLRANINMIGAKLQSLAVPADIDFFKRTAFMTQNVYLDSADPNKAQSYMFVPTGWYSLEEFTPGEAGYLMFNNNPGVNKVNGFTGIKEYWNLANTMLDKLITSESIGIMSGDIKKAYGANIIGLTPLSEDSSIVPIYDEAVLSQIENSRAWGQIRPLTDKITQDTNTNALVFNPDVDVHRGAAAGTILNMRKSQPEPADVMEATRLMSFVDDIDASTNEIVIGKIITCGTEYVERYRVYTQPWYPALDNKPWVDVYSSLYFSVGTTGVVSKAFDAVAAISKFDWHPLISLIVDNDEGSLVDKGFMHEVQNYTIVNSADIQRLHEVAILSELDVPVFGSKQ